MSISKQIYIARLKSHPVECLAEVYKEKADVLSHTGEYNRATEEYAKAKAFYEKLNKKSKCGEINYQLGNVLENKGSFQEAEQYFNLALEAFVESCEENNIAKCYREIGKLYQYRENPDTALAFYGKAGDLYKRCGDDHGQHVIMEYTADIYRTKGDFKEALELLNRLEIISEGLNEMGTLCRINKLTGTVYMDQQNFKKANAFLNRAYQITDKTGEKSIAMHILCDLGAICYYQADYQLAYTYFKECLDLAEKLDSEYMRTVNLVNVADSLLKLGNVERSKGYISRAATINHNIGGLNNEIERIQKEIAEKEAT